MNNKLYLTVNELIKSDDFGQSLFLKSNIPITTIGEPLYNYRIDFYNGQINKLVYESPFSYDYIWTKLKEYGWKYTSIVKNIPNISVYNKENVTCILRKNDKTVTVCFFKKIID